MAYGNNISCVLENCENSTSSCTYTCLSSTTFPLPLPPPPPPSPPPSHVAPFLIATVCILGISFLLLSTCTIILRYRFSFRRRRDPHDGDDEVVNGGGGGGPSSVDHPIWNITTVGLHQSVIDSITAFKYKKIDGFLMEESCCSCSVCLTEFEEGDDLRLLPKCTHAFHVCCIDTWLRSHKNCPLCRAPVVSDVEESERLNLDGPEEGGSSSGSRDDHLGELLPVLEEIRLAEILKKNRELRIFSDLGENRRFRGVEEGLELIRRSISMNGIGGLAMCEGVVGNEGCSSVGSSKLKQKKVDLEKGEGDHDDKMKSSSIDRLLQKGPVSMKRSLSSSSRFFSFRRTKSQASILPL